MQTAIAAVIVTQAGSPIPGAIAHLETGDGKLLLLDIANVDGYLVFNNVPVPFVGKLKIAGAAQYYEQPVSISGNNVTLRVGPSQANPQDLMLPAAVPFV